MKKSLVILMLIFLVTGCKKDNISNENQNNDDNNNKWGSLFLNMKYNSTVERSIKKSVSKKTGSDTLYTHFGDYITSISPSAFIGKFLDMRLFNFAKNDTIWNYGFNIIDNNTPIDSINRLANFINQSTVNFTLNPKIIPESEDGVFNIFVFIPLYFYQEFELPSQYDTIPHLENLDFGNGNVLNNFDGHYIGGNRTGLLIKGGSDPFMYPIFDPSLSGLNSQMIPKNYVFGSCDSTYICYSDIIHKKTIDNPLGQYGYIIRSNSFSTITLPIPTDRETTTVNGSMTFDSHDLIQIYTGVDNVPFTSDDVFIYAPNYWERLSVIMAVN
jgi:hypothetical protein